MYVHDIGAEIPSVLHVSNYSLGDWSREYYQGVRHSIMQALNERPIFIVREHFGLPHATRSKSYFSLIAHYVDLMKEKGQLEGDELLIGEVYKTEEKENYLFRFKLKYSHLESDINPPFEELPENLQLLMLSIAKSISHVFEVGEIDKIDEDAYVIDGDTLYFSLGFGEERIEDWVPEQFHLVGMSLYSEVEYKQIFGPKGPPLSSIEYDD